MADIKELGNKITSTLGALLAGGVLLVMGTWVGAEIYFEFQHLKREADRIELDYKEEIARVEKRLNTITKRNADAIKTNTDGYNTLKLPNSDN